MFVYTTLEESYAEHERLLGWEKELLDKLELAYRVIDVAAGDLGLSAQRKFDCEAWIPTQGTLPRAHLDLELHRVPGAAPRHPRPRRGREHRAGGDAERHAVRGHRARSSRSWRPTSRPTARCASRRPCGPTCRAARCWSPSTRDRPRTLHSPAGRARHRRDAVRQRAVDRAGRGDHQRPRGGRRPPGVRRRGARRAGHRAVDVRHHPRLGPPRPAGRRHQRPRRRQQRVGDVPLPAGRGAHHRDLRRQRDRQDAAGRGAQRGGRGRGGRRGLPHQPALPRRRDHRLDAAAEHRGAGGRAGHPRDHPRPALLGGGVPRARREARPAGHELLHRLDRLARHRARRHLQGVGARGRGRGARRQAGRRARDRRRPQRHRDAPLGRPRGRDGAGAARGAGGGRRRHGDGHPRRGRRGAVPLVLEGGPA